LAGKQVVPPVIGYPSQGGNLPPKKRFLVTSKTFIGYQPSREVCLTKDKFQHHSLSVLSFDVLKVTPLQFVKNMSFASWKV